LARFTDTGTKDGRICVFDMVAKRSFPQNPKNLAYEWDFNRVDFEGHPPDVLEKAFGELIEWEAASVSLRMCQENRIPEDEEFSYVLNLITLLAVRHPVMRRSMEAARQLEYRAFFDALASNRALYESHLKSAFDNGFISRTDVSFEQMQQQIRRGNYKIRISAQDHLHTERSAFEDLLSSVSSRRWSLLMLTRTRQSLLHATVR